MGEAWQGLWEVLRQDLADLPDLPQLFRITLRLLFAVCLGGALGFERERLGKAAGLRTHMLVALGAALIVLVPQQAGMEIADLSRVIQGIVTGIGFIGGGAILKLSEQREIKGLTTAAGLWLTAAVGMAAGLGRLGLAFLSLLLAWVILSVLHRFEHHSDGRGNAAS
jgi:putative Mg2+ transporter-C (MgtC) family protein